jgi:type II secretory pathway pseudopilin PulG
MIKFFRKIRQKMLTENKFSKYLLYAIGEIVLVMIGILLALQVNNWNESQKAIKKEQFYLAKLEENLKQDSLSLSLQIERLKIKLKNIKELSLLNNISIDSLNLPLVNALLSTSGFSSEITTWQNLQNTGKIDIIKNQALVDSLYIYHNFNESNIKVWMESDQSYSRLNIAPFLMRNFDLNYGVPSDSQLHFESNDKELTYFNNQEDFKYFKNSLRYKNNASLSFLFLFENQEKRAKNILELIKKDLDKYKK